MGNGSDTCAILEQLDDAVADAGGTDVSIGEATRELAGAAAGFNQSDAAVQCASQRELGAGGHIQQEVGR